MKHKNKATFSSSFRCTVSTNGHIIIAAECAPIPFIIIMMMMTMMIKLCVCEVCVMYKSECGLTCVMTHIWGQFSSTVVLEMMLRLPDLCNEGFHLLQHLAAHMLYD